MNDTVEPSGNSSKNSVKQSSASVDPFSLVKKIKSRGPAPVHLWDPPFCGDIDMRIAKDGTWYHQGSPIRRLPMVKLFASILKVEEGEHFLVTPVEKVRIQVEDCPFVAQQMDVIEEDGVQILRFTTNTEEVVDAGAECRITVTHNAETKEPHPIVHARNGLNALLSRAVFYRLVEMAEQKELEGKEVLGVYSNTQFFSLGSI